MRIRTRPKSERILLSVVLILSILMSVGIYSYRDKIVKGRVLMQELFILRTAVTIYRTVNGFYPAELKTLFQQTYKLSDGRERQYLSGIKLDDKKGLLDPFGVHYMYDIKNGWVYSATKGFNNW